MKMDEAGRLAFREEGRMWNCYLAGPHSMEGATLVGSILLRVIEENEEIKAQFMACMQAALTYVFKEALGLDVDRFEEREPPEKDRTRDA